MYHLACLTHDEFNEAFDHGKNIRENLYNDSIPLDLSRYIVVSGILD